MIFQIEGTIFVIAAFVLFVTLIYCEIVDCPYKSNDKTNNILGFTMAGSMGVMFLDILAMIITLIWS